MQSCPRPSQPWHYGFHADVEFATAAQLEALLAELPTVTEELRVLGAYQRGSMEFGQETAASSVIASVAKQSHQNELLEL